MSSHSSKDFHKVPPKLSAQNVEKLIDPDLLSAELSSGERQFTNERNHFVKIVDLPSHTMSMTIGGLEPGQSTRNHRHNYETLLYIVEGRGQSIIEGNTVEWKKGDAVYVPVWAWHQHVNLSSNEKALYVACENAPMLQNLGNIALREEQ